MLDEADRLLAAGQAFAAHEVLESAWKAAPASERDLWRGLAQVAVGLTHRQRGNPTGARTLFLRAAGLLADYAPPDARTEGTGSAALVDLPGVLAAVRRLADGSQATVRLRRPADSAELTEPRVVPPAGQARDVEDLREQPGRETPDEPAIDLEPRTHPPGGVSDEHVC